MPTRALTEKNTPGAISQLELAKFLMQLADLYASPEYGNPALADALRELASTVNRKGPMETSGNKSKNEGFRKLSLDQLNELKALDHASIRIFLPTRARPRPNS